MRKDLADVTVVVDRSGSMAACRFEAENGINCFIENQKKHAGELLFSLVQFDTEYEFVHRGLPISDVPKFNLVPRGMTALLDAVGRAINETGERLSCLKEEERPGLVIFVIVTDGHENSSHEFTKAQIKEIIERQIQTYNWQFTFLGANQDAFAEAQGMGIPIMSTSTYTPQAVNAAYNAASANVLRMRSATISGKEITNSYTPEECRSMKGETTSRGLSPDPKKK